MSLQFVIGPSGSGKSHYLHQWVTAEAEKNRNQRFIMLVPDQFTMQTQKDLIRASHNKGILNIEVLSFNRLAYRILNETGKDQVTVLDDIGKNFVLRKVAGKCEGKLRVLGGNLRKPGYISEIKSVISEFMQYDIFPETMDDITRSVENVPGLYYKLQDIQKVYAAFREYLENRYITGEELLDILAQVVDQSQLLKGSVLVLDGFTGFTPVQKRLIGRLMSVCEKMLVAVTKDEGEDPYQLYRMSDEMIAGLRELAEESGCALIPPICFFERPFYRFGENQVLAHLEKSLFRTVCKSLPAEGEAVQIWCAENPEKELDFVAQQIRKLVRTQGYRYRDIAVLSAAVGMYAPRIEKIFEKYNIPVFTDQKRSILMNSCVEFVRSLLEMSEEDFTYRSVFRYLRCGYSSIEDEEVDLLENYVIAMGIKGYSTWNTQWIRRSRGMKESDLAEVNRIRQAVAEELQEVVTVLKQRVKTVRQVTEALHTFFLKIELQQKVEDRRSKFEAEGELELEKEYGQIYRIVIGILDRLVELLGDERISMKEYREILEAGLEEAKVGIIPPGVDQVVVGDVERSRICNVKVVFLVGANDIYIPGNAREGGLLSEYDRRQITERGTKLAPDATEQVYIQKFYLYLMLTKASQRVYLTYSNVSWEYKKIRRSYLISEVQKIYEGMQIRQVPSAFLEKEVTPKSGLEEIILGLQNKEEGLSDEWQELYCWYKRHPEWHQKLEQILDGAFYSYHSRHLDEETAKSLFGEQLRSSITRIEGYSACAFSHFLKYGLRLREREEYQFQSMDVGTLFHGAIERFSKKVDEEGYDWKQIPDEKRELWVDECVEQCVTEFDNTILYSSERNRYIINRMKRLVGTTVWAIAEQLKCGDFAPEGYEVKFKGAGGEIGIIDRIDICEEGDTRYVKIIDYKVYKKKVELQKLYEGLQLQLILYLRQAVEREKRNYPDKKIVPAAVMYYCVDDPLVDKSDDSETVRRAILMELRPEGMILDSDKVIRHLDRDIASSSVAVRVKAYKSGEKVGNLLSEDEFQLVMDFAEEKVRESEKEILDGCIKAAPYKEENQTACDYCPYKGICRFEETMPGYGYREVKKQERGAILENMRKKVADEN